MTPVATETERPGSVKRIAAIGSSATKGFNIKEGEAWPEQLEGLCREAGFRVEVSNRATHGLALQAFAERILHLEHSDPYDLYLIQIPIPNRAYFGVNGTRKLREEDCGKEVAFGWSPKTSRVSPTRILITGGSLDEDSPFHKYLKSFFYPIVRRNNPNIAYEDFLAYLRFWEANVRDSDLELLNYIKELVLLQYVLKTVGKPYLMFQWCGMNLQRLKIRTEPFWSLVDWSPFVFRGEQTAYEYLNRNHAAQYETLQADGYHHLNRAGNRIIAEELVLPAIRRCLSEAM
jgi:hypothetical protein